MSRNQSSAFLHTCFLGLFLLFLPSCSLSLGKGGEVDNRCRSCAWVFNSQLCVALGPVISCCSYYLPIQKEPTLSKNESNHHSIGINIVI